MSDRLPGSRPIAVGSRSESDSTARARMGDSATGLSEVLLHESLPNCCPDSHVLSAFTSGLLPMEVCESIAQHVEVCEACLRQLDAQSHHLPKDAMHEALAALAQEEWAPSITSKEREALKALAPPSDAGQELSGHEHFHEYQLIEEIGKGGMGTVYRALHIRLNKEVALKTISPAAFSIPGAVSRFESEMRALGQISHPNIVSASDAGVFEQTHYLVMEYIKGTDLAAILKQRGRLGVPLVVHILNEVCAGLRAAHRCGLVHRDIKPSNIMLVPDVGGLGVVKILDLGLSALHPDVGRVEPGGSGPDDAAPPNWTSNQEAIVGTFDYMAPEQARRGVAPAPSMDLYSLGCTCFHLLVGRAPFRQQKPVESPVANCEVRPHGLIPMTAREKLDAHVTSPVPNIKQLRDDVPDWLCQLVQQLMAKDPLERPQSVDEVLASIAQANRTGIVRQGNNVGLLTALAMFAFLLCGVVYRLVTDTGTLEITPLDEKVQVEISQNGKRVKIIDTENSNRIELHSGQFDLKVANRQDVTIDKTSVELRRGDKVVVQLKFVPENKELTQTTTAPVNHRLTVQQTILRVIQGELKIPGLQAVLGQPLAAELLEGLSVKSLEYSPDGLWLAAATSNVGGNEEVVPGELFIIEAKSGRVNQRLRPHTAGINKVTWAKDNQSIFTGGNDGRVAVTDVHTGQQRRTIEMDGYVFGLDVNESGNLLAVSCGHTVYILDWPSGTIRHRLRSQGAGVEDVAFRGDAEVIALGGTSLDHVWTLGETPQLKTYTHNNGRAADISVPKSSFDDGADPLVWACGYDGRCLAWNAQTGVLSKQLIHPWVASSVHASANGMHVLSSDWHGSVRLWATSTGQLQKVVHGRGAFVSRFSPDGKSVVIGSYRNTVYAVDIETGQPVWSTRTASFDDPFHTRSATALDRYAHASEIVCVSSSPTTKTLASAAHDGSVIVWDSLTQRMLGPLDHLGGQILLLEFVDNGQRLIAVTRESFATEWNVEARQTLSRHWCATATNVRTTAAALNPHNHVVALAREHHGIELWDRRENRLLRKLKDSPSGVTQLAFSEDGRSIWALDRGRLCSWDAESGLEKREVAAVGAHRMCRLGSRLLIANTRNKVTVFDQDGNKLFDFETPHGDISKIKTNPQGDQAMVVSLLGKRASLWKVNADNAQLQRELKLLPEQLMDEETDFDWDFENQQSFVGNALGVILIGKP